MRLVDADTAIPLIQEDKIEGKTLDMIKALGDGLQAETLNQACDRHIKIINSLPTIESKRGKWIDKGWNGDWQFQTDGRGNCWHEWECSECEFITEGAKWNYCPNCGARMGGGEK